MVVLWRSRFLFSSTILGELILCSRISDAPISLTNILLSVLFACLIEACKEFSSPDLILMRRTSSLIYFSALCCFGEVYAISFGSKCIAFRSISCCYCSVTLRLALCSCKLWFVSRIYPSSSSSSGYTITSCISSYDSSPYSLCALASRMGDGSTVLGYGRVVIS